MDWRNKNVLVTGAGGFIGSHLTETLVALGANARGFLQYRSDGSRGWLTRSKFENDIEFCFGNLLDINTLKPAIAGRDVVFHLGALIAIPYSYGAPISYLRTNGEGTLNVLQVSRDLGVQLLVHTSTSEVYGTAQYVPIDEKHPLQGQSPYSASKIAADKFAEAYHLSFDLPVATIRPFNTYGPRQSARAVIPSIIVQALTQEYIQLGNLKPTRDFNFVENTIDGFLAMATTPNAVGEVINIGSGYEISIGELANLILDLMGKRNLPIQLDDIRVRTPGTEVNQLCADNQKAADMIGWIPRVGLVDGLIQTISWVTENLNKFDRGGYVI